MRCIRNRLNHEAREGISCQCIASSAVDVHFVIFVVESFICRCAPHVSFLMWVSISAWHFALEG